MINSHKVTKHACTSSWSPLAHSIHHTYHQVTVMNKRQKKKKGYKQLIYIYISHVNVTQTVPDISPLMPMHQDPLLVCSLWLKIVGLTVQCMCLVTLKSRYDVLFQSDWESFHKWLMSLQNISCRKRAAISEIIIIQSCHNFACVITALMSWHMQNCDLMESQE